VKRQESHNDRRRIHLTLTSNGEALLIQARPETQAYLEARLAALPETEIEEIIRAMQSLRSVFSTGEEIEDDLGG
jgi:DNA-binding MarR family transcriptional regulator